jgi:hypothetical protein
MINSVLILLIGIVIGRATRHITNLRLERENNLYKIKINKKVEKIKHLEERINRLNYIIRS